jgi:hypothetical protein
MYSNASGTGFGTYNSDMYNAYKWQETYDKVLERLLSPEEFGRLDSNLTSAYGGYMGDLNAYAKQQKAKKSAPEAYQAVQNGTYEPFGYAVANDVKATSTRGRQIPTAAEAAKGMRIPTTLHKDITGKTTQELASGGVYRDMGGEVIPQTAEQVGAKMQLDRAIPVAEMESDTAFLNTIGNLKTAQSNMAFNKRQEAALKVEQAQERIGQGDIRLEQGQQRLDDQNTRFEKSLDHRSYIVKVQQMGREALAKLKDTLNTNNAELKNEYAVNMATLKGEIPGTPEALLKHAEISARQIELLRAKQKIDITEEQRKDTAARLQKQLDFSYWLEKLSYKPDFPSDQKPGVVRAAINERSQTQPQSDQSPVQGAQQVNVNGQIIWAVQLPNGKWKKVQ